MAPVTRRTGLAVTVLLLGSLGLGCQGALQRPGLPPLSGRVGAAWRTQATLADFTPGGIVSLIDPAGDRTVAGTITQADGSFTLSFEPDLQPANGSAYWLDVSRRRTEGWLTLRTAAVWSDGRWLSISNGPDKPSDPVLINARTTAIALLLQDSGAGFATVLGKAGATGLNLGAGRTDATASEVQARVQAALTADRDPLALSAGGVLDLTPAVAVPAGTVTVSGYGFGSGGTATVGGEPAVVSSWRPGQIVLQPPVSGKSGDLVIKPDGGRPILSGLPLRIRQQWRTWPDLPTPVGGDSVAVGWLTGQLVVAGGKDATGKAIGLVWGYASRNGEWRALAPMPTPRYGLASAVLGNHLYAIGGWTNASGYSAAVEAYDPVTDSWSRRAPLPAGLLGAAAAAVNGKLLVCGGFNGTEQGSTYLYDPGTDTWQTKAALPQARYRHGAAAFDGRVVVAGGRSGNQPTANAVQYDLVADVWSNAANLPAARSGGVLLCDGRTAWFLNGSDGRPQANLWVSDGASWLNLASPPTARSGISGTLGDGELIIVGGTSGDAAAGRRVESFVP